MPHNTPRLKNYRMLELLPSTTLKQFAGNSPANKKAAIERILDHKTRQEIETFISERVSICKQHVYLFRPQRALTIRNFPILAELDDGFRLIRRVGDASRSDNLHLYTITQTFISIARNEFINVQFYLPIRIVAEPNCIKIHIVILERDTTSVDGVEAELRHKSISELNLLRNITTLLQTGTRLTLSPLDINPGIKHLWGDDIIDSPYVKSKSDRSTSLETMDRNLYLKRDYNERYLEIIDRPLMSTVFHCLQRQGDLGYKFACEPNHGRLAFTSYSSETHIDGLISHILQHN